MSSNPNTEFYLIDFSHIAVTECDLSVERIQKRERI